MIIMAATMGIGTLTLVSAFARRIAGPYGRGRLAREALRHQLGMGDAGSSQALEELREEVEQLRVEVADLRSRAGEMDDVQNRLDFAERMLAQVREKNALPGGRA